MIKVLPVDSFSATVQIVLSYIELSEKKIKFLYTTALSHSQRYLQYETILRSALYNETKVKLEPQDIDILVKCSTLRHISIIFSYGKYSGHKLCHNRAIYSLDENWTIYTSAAYIRSEVLV